ncbi:hypothetical protein F5Y17DRAFT_451951 [Xylariaceae sp. FL0594]|nr:hypothetical protein F5Y17DRAFT_451951 [Xylariaceae sp. FL0594]
MSEANFSHPVNPDDQGLGPTTKALTWLFTSFAIVAVSLRFYLRRKFAGGTSVEDWIMALALALQVVYSAILTKACDSGLGMTFANLTWDKYLGLKYWTFVALPFTHAVSVLARISITILLIRIFGQSKPWFKWFLIVYTTIQAVFGIISIVLAIVDELPVEAHYDPNVTPTSIIVVPQEAISETLQFLYAICDLAYVIFPVTFIYRLQMPLRRRIGLVLLLGLSAITFAAAFAKALVVALALTGRFVLTGPDFNGLFFYVSTVEQCLVIIIGCVPALRSVVKIDIPMFSAIGETLNGLISRSRRSSKSDESSLPYHDNIEMGPHKIRLDDEGYERTHAVNGGEPPANAPQDGRIRRTDSFGITVTRG